MDFEFISQHVPMTSVQLSCCSASGVTTPEHSPSITTTGASPHVPKHRAVSKLTLPSARRFARLHALAAADRLQQLAARL